VKPITGLSFLRWRHPDRGEITETVCMAHRKQVSAALRTLGIGSVLEQPTATGACLRCCADAEGSDPRFRLGLMGL
jgi:hypothetical protein